MSRFGRCCICTTSFETTDVCSLRCGHTYHTECINQWIKNSKTCPNCRKKTIARDIVKLFFDEADMSFTQAPADFGGDADSEKMINELTSSLTAEKENVKKLLSTFEDFQNEVKSLKSQLKFEKKKSATLTLKDERIKNLESLLRNQSEMESELKVWKARVKASEFFRYLIKKDVESNESSIDKYLTTAGDVDQKKFFEIIRKQRKNLEKQLNDLNIQINALKKEIGEKTNKNKKYKQFVVDLKRENDNLKKKSLFPEDAHESLFDTSNFSDESIARPSMPKKSLGFSFADDTLDSSALLRSAQRTAHLKDLPSTSNDNGKDTKVPLNFGDLFSDEEEENENPSSALLLCGEKNNAKVEENFLNDNIDFDVPVTRSLLDNKINGKKDIIIPKRKLLLRPSEFNRSIAILDEIEALEGTSSGFSNDTNNRMSRKNVKKTKISSPPIGIKRYFSDQSLADSSETIKLPAKSKPTRNRILDLSSSFELSPLVLPKGPRRISSNNNSIEVIELD